MTESTKVLESVKFITENAKDVFIQEDKCRAAATEIYNAMLKTNTLQTHGLLMSLTPRQKTQVPLIGSLPLILSTLVSGLTSIKGHWQPCIKVFAIEYKGNTYTGYWSLCAAINKALDNGVPITSPKFWASDSFTKDTLAQVFKSASNENIFLLDERFQVLKEAGEVLTKVCMNSRKLRVFFFLQLTSNRNSMSARLLKLFLWQINPQLNSSILLQVTLTATMMSPSISVTKVSLNFQLIITV